MLHKGASIIPLLEIQDEIVSMGYNLFMKDTETKTRGAIFVKI